MLIKNSTSNKKVCVAEWSDEFNSKNVTIAFPLWNILVIALF